MFPIRSDWPRLSAEELARWGACPSALIADGNGGAGVLAGVQPLDAASRFAGNALTVHAAPGDNQILWRAVQETRPGDVVVVRTGAHRRCALLGDIVAEYFQRAGAAALVTDGLVRDAAATIRLGFPVCCAGLHSAAPAELGGYSIGFPVIVAGVLVRAGDLVVGDADGVVAVRREDAERVQAGMQAKQDREQSLRASLAAAEALPEGGANQAGGRPYLRVAHRRETDG